MCEFIDWLKTAGVCLCTQCESALDGKFTIANYFTNTKSLIQSAINQTSILL